MGGSQLRAEPTLRPGTWPDALTAGAHAVLEVARTRDIRLKTIPVILKEIAQVSGAALQVARVSVWILRDGDLDCSVLVEHGRAEAPAPPMRLSGASCPVYLERLRGELAVALENVRDDPACEGLQDYLQAHGITSMLDVPLALGGQLLGVICHEHVGSPRRWSKDEILFGSLVASVLIAQLEAERRLRAELRAEGTEARYAHLVESLPVVVYSFDVRQGALEYLSPNIVELSGLSAEAWMVRGGVRAWVEAIEPEDRPPIVARFEHAPRESFDPDVTYAMRLPDGRRIYVRDRCSIVRDPLGRPVSLHGMLSDVTAEHAALLETREHARRFRELLDRTELCAVTLDLDGRVTFANPALLALLGRTGREVQGADWLGTVVTPADRPQLQAYLRREAFERHLPARLEYSVTTTAGAERRLLWTNVVLMSADGPPLGVAALGVDLSERDREEARRHHAQRLESLGQLAAAVAHDFNNLLHLISLTAEELQERLSPEVHPLLSDQRMATQQAQALVKALLSFARGREPANMPIALDEHIRTAAPLLLRAAGAHGRAPELNAAGALVAVDGAQLQQVLMNLVTNAAQAMHGRRGSIRIHTADVQPDPERIAREGLDPRQRFVRLRVADQGVGMPPELLEKIFEPFFTTKADRGTGLGLATALAIVRRAGGFIEVESSPGVGSTFDVWLPVLA